MDRNNIPEDNMELTKKDTKDDDSPSAAEVLADETGKPTEEFTPDTKEHPHPHPNQVETIDLRDEE